jgi:hydroxyacylglutathione hydrolase
MTYHTFTGGLFDTNCYLVDVPEGAILFDAPEGSCAWLRQRGTDLKMLILTHGHIDHVQDVASIKKAFLCPIGCHPETVPMISDPAFFRRFGFGFDLEPTNADFLINETLERDFLGLKLQVLEVPGHCPGSLCFLDAPGKVLIGGDVLFAGGVGRWDLPGGDADLLFQGIKTKLFALGDEVTVLPGHGEPTTIGAERRSNPFVS